MRKGSSSRSSAYSTPLSLTSLLAPTVLEQPLVEPISEVHAVDLNRQGVPFDGREYHPEKGRAQSPGAFVRSAAKLLAGRGHVVGFSRPNIISICIRRKARREVLHALRRTKSGRGGGRRRNRWSMVKC